MATHTNVTLKILGQELSLAQRKVLEGVPYAKNSVYLHRDASLMPRDPGVWASWNCLDQTVVANSCPAHAGLRGYHQPDVTPR